MAIDISKLKNEITQAKAQQGCGPVDIDEAEKDVILKVAEELNAQWIDEQLASGGGHFLNGGNPEVRAAIADLYEGSLRFDADMISSDTACTDDLTPQMTRGVVEAFADFLGKPEITFSMPKEIQSVSVLANEIRLSDIPNLLGGTVTFQVNGLIGESAGDEMVFEELSIEVARTDTADDIAAKIKDAAKGKYLLIEEPKNEKGEVVAGPFGEKVLVVHLAYPQEEAATA